MEVYNIEDKKNSFLIKKESKYFRVNELTLEILLMHEEGKSVSEITSILNNNNISLKQMSIENIIKRYMQSNSNRHKYVWGSFKIIDLRKIYPLLKILSCTFYTPFMIVALLIFSYLMFSLKIFDWDINKITINKALSDNYIIWILFFVISFFITLIHEIGHAVACYRFKTEPQEIGFGFYLFFPIMFTDVSSAWKLSRRKRLIIDCAGFYYQIIVIIILSLLVYFFNSFSFLGKILIYQNLILIVYNLNPLFRFDGYWIFSDAFNLVNLREQSMKAFKQTINNIYLFFKKQSLEKRKYSIVVYIYSIISNVFLLTIFLLFCYFAVHKIIYIYHSIFDYIKYGKGMDWFYILLISFSIIIGGYCTVKSVIKNFNYLKK